MASDILHIKDSYYFEVPGALAPKHYTELKQVPDYLRKLHAKDFHVPGEHAGHGEEKGHDHASHEPASKPLFVLDPDSEYTTFIVNPDVEQHLSKQELAEKKEAVTKHALEEYSHQLTGKILIPQFFGTPKSLYDSGSGFAVSKFMVLELVVAILMVVTFTWLKKKMLTEHPTKGRLANFLEAFLHYIRQEIAIKNIGHDGDKFVPLLWTIFFFILGCNVLGLVPWTGTATAAFETNLTLAFGVLLTTFFAGFQAFGPKWLWTGFVPHMDLPVWLSPLKLGIYAIELLGMFIKHAVLAIRLLANMAAGHLVLLAILGLIISSAQSVEANYPMTATFAVIGATLLSLLELGVAFLQAYIFTLLSALFIGSAAHEH